MTTNPNLWIITSEPKGRGDGFVVARPIHRMPCDLLMRGASRTMAILLVSLCCRGFQVAPAQDIHWLRAKQLADRLASPVSVEWSFVQFRSALGRLSHAQRVSVLVDRRVDPNQRCEFRCQEEALSEVFTQLARTAHCGYTQFGPVAYFGPTTTARQLRTLAALMRQQVDELPPASRRIWHRTRIWRWDDLASPRQLIEGLAAEQGVKLTGTELIPHDLWASGDLPPLMLAERLLLIAVQFNLTIEIDREGRSARLVQVPLEVALRRRYSGRGNPERIAQHYQELAPTARVDVQGRDVLVSGLVEDHERLSGGLSKKTKMDHSSAGTQVFRLKVENVMVARLLDHVSQRLGYTIRIDEPALTAAGLSLQQRVSVDVADATIDALMKAILEPAGLTYRRQGKTLEVMPLKP